MYQRLRPPASAATPRRHLHTKVERSYNDVVNLLNSTQVGFRALENRRRTGYRPSEVDVVQMKDWLRQIGYSPADLTRLNPIHVAGTKGKGSTSSLVSSILNAHRLSLGVPSKVGLYTSPHLTSVRERIRLNEAPISEALFARYFSEVWDALEGGERPGYFRMLTLLSFHVFLEEGVDAAVYEVGVGGAFDATNVFEAPAAAGILDLGIDHVGTLGGTLGEIAWHKAGVMKGGAPAFTVAQEPEAMGVLRERAREVGTELVEVDVHPGLRDVRVRPDEEYQRRNASMAIQLSVAALQKLGVELDVSRELPKEVVQGIESVNWRGRCETLAARGMTWYLDGAHTEESLEIACRWFGRASKEKDAPCAMVFNQQSDRDAADMLRHVHRKLVENGVRIKHAVFCTNVTYKDASTRPELANSNVDPDVVSKLTLQNTLAETWRELEPGTEVVVIPSIEEVMEYLGTKVELQVLVTGSFHLVGGVLSVLEGEDSGLKRAGA